VTDRPRAGGSPGLAGLRRAGTVTDLLFLEACATLEPTQLRPVAEALGLTVQAVSHVFRSLRARGWVAYQEGRYRPTLQGVAWLHETLTGLGDDVRARLGRLHVIRSTGAVARGPLADGEAVVLEIVDGLLTARPGSTGGSRGRVLRGGRSGSLVQVGDLEGIVPITPAPIQVRTLPPASLFSEELPRRLARALRGRRGPVAAVGLEAYLVARSAGAEPIARFAPTYVCLEASRVGVPSTLVTLERDLPRVLGELAAPSPPPVEVVPLDGRRRGATGRGRRRRSGGKDHP